MQINADRMRLGCFRANALAKLCLVFLIGLAAVVARAQNFGSPFAISGDWGTYVTNNTAFTADIGAPNIAGYAPHAPAWFQWTASHNGEVDLDTVGSVDSSGNNLDTVLGVYTGTSITTLNQIAANVDLYPLSGNQFALEYEAFTGGGGTQVQPAYYGPSHLRFSAQAGVTYYFAVDTRQGKGTVSLSWAYESSGVFRFATEASVENLGPGPSLLPLYQTSQTESGGPGGAGLSDTYYKYDAPGLLVTVTRAAGSRGRVLVNYQTEDGTALPFIPPGEVAGLAGTDYTAVSGTLVFDDFEMSKTILVPIVDPGIIAGDQSNRVFGVQLTSVALDPNESSEVSNARLDPVASTAMVNIANVNADPYGPDMVPQVVTNYPTTNFSFFGTTIITNILNFTNLAPAPTNQIIFTNYTVTTPVTLSTNTTAITNIVTFTNIVPLNLTTTAINSATFTNIFQVGTDTNIIGTIAVGFVFDTIATVATATNTITTLTAEFAEEAGTLDNVTNVVTNMVVALYPTNAVINFTKANYRVAADVNDPSIAPYDSVSVSLEILRTGTNEAAQTVNYQVDEDLNTFGAGGQNDDNEFPLQPGSDYAIPTGSHWRANNGPDFTIANGTVTIPQNIENAFITFTVPYTNLATRFNKDFQVSLYQVNGNNTIYNPGNNCVATVTVLFNDQHPPAGSVDEFYNTDLNDEMATLPSLIPVTSPGDNGNPGVGSPLYAGQVYSIAALTNNEALVGGDFPTYNGTTRNGVALVQANGQLDLSFNPGTGISGDITGQGNDARINASAISGGEFYIGGNFTAYNNIPAGCIALVNASGNLDTSFNVGSGANGTVRAIAVQTNGEVLVGGDFTSFNGTPCNYLVLLKANGTVDTNFNETAIQGPVYSLALAPTLLTVTNPAASFSNEVDTVINLGAYNAGTLTVNYNMTQGPDDMKVYYGNTNFNAGTGALIYDTGNVFGSGQAIIPFGPTNGVNANYLTIVMNQSNDLFNINAAWNYQAIVTVAQNSSAIIVGGNFPVAGQGYGNIARLNADGSLDTTFSPITGPNGIVHAVAMQFNNQVVAGGEFNAVNGLPTGYIERFNTDGSIDNTNFFAGTGADDAIYSLNVNWDGTIYIGGSFDLFNGTHRRGFARLYSNGTVDTTFLDSAYNQFAGLKRIFSSDTPAVFSAQIQYNGGVLIGGSFLQVGGGQANPDVCDILDENLGLSSFGSPESFDDPNLWVEPKARDGVRNRTGFARLIGGATPGPGNIGMAFSSISQDKSQTPMSVGIVRTNGTLGPITANFSMVNGTAKAGQDFSYQANQPVFWIAWLYITYATQMREDGLWGISGEAPLLDALGQSLPLQNSQTVGVLANVSVNIIANQNNAGNLNAQMQLANPSYSDTFYLGGEAIPTGAALGIPSSLLSLIDDTTLPGQFGFISTNYIATNLAPAITLVRSNGTFGIVSMRAWATNGTAVNNVDYRGVTNKLVVFNTGATTTNFTVTILNDGSVSKTEKTINMYLSNLGTTPGATFGYSNAVLRIINPNFPGFVTLSASNFLGSTASGVLNFVINRVAGDQGVVTVQYATTNGVGPNAAINGVDYNGSTNTLTWNSGDVSPRTISVPLLPTQVAGGTNKQFGVYLFNPTLTGTNDSQLLGAITNSALIITNNNSYGTIQFAPTNYIVDEYGGYIVLTITRTGGTSGTVSVNYATMNGTALADTTHGAVTNYIATNGVLVFAPGQISTNITVPVLNDGITDPANFYFKVNLSAPVNATLGSASSATVNILDVQSYNQPPGTIDTTFNPSGMNGGVYSLTLQTNGQIIAAGAFTAVGDTAMGSIARLNADGTLDATFLNDLAGANAPVNSVVCQTTLSDAGRILIGGAFTSVDGQNRYFIARLQTDGSVDSSFNPGAGANAVVNAVAESFYTSGANTYRNIYIGGAFTTYNGNTSPGIERLNNNGSVDYTFNAGGGLDGPVYAIAVYPTNSIYWGKILVAGSFAHYNGAAANNLVRLNSDGSLDTNFSAMLGSGPSAPINALAIQVDNKILIGGAFTNINGTAANYIARLNADASVDTSFTAASASGADGIVESIAVQPDTRILVAGEFSSFNSVPRNHITRLLPTGAVDPSINFGDGANGNVDTLAIQPANNAIVIGGTFSEYDDQPAGNIAEIFGGSETGTGEFEFNAANYYVHETGSFATITIERIGGTSGPNSNGTGNINVDFYTTNLPAVNAATNGVNYQATNEIVSFPPGADFETVSIPVFDDGAVESTNLIVGLGLSGAAQGYQNIAQLNIINDDSGISFLNPAYYTIDKNDPTGLATIDIIRQGGTNVSSTVEFSTTTNGTAIAGLDYAPTNEIVTFAPGVSLMTAQVGITNNGLVEGNRTVGLALQNVQGSEPLSPTNGVLTIIDTTPSPGQLSLSTNAYFANKTDTNAYVTVVRTDGTTGTVSVGLEVQPGTALPGVNYVAPAQNPIPITLANGQSSQTIALPLVPNNLVQGTVYLSVSLTNVTGGATLAGSANATVSIINNVNTGVSFVQATNTTSETNTPLVVLVQRLGAANNAFTINYATANGSAIAGVNYTTTTGTLTFAANTLFQSINLPILDAQSTTNLSFTLNLSNPVNVQLVSPSSSQIVVQGSRAGLFFTNSAISVYKNSGIVAIPVICNNPGLETSPITVNYSTANGTATAGQDYTTESGTLTFANGTGTNYIYVPILNNSLITGSRTFTVTLSNPAFPGSIIFPGTQAITIIDSNSGLSFSQPTYTAIRSAGSATITVVRTDNTNTVSSVNFATGNGTATAGVDYFPTNGVLVFSNGVVSQSFNVGLISSTTVQPDESVLLQLSNPTNGLLAFPSAATFVVHDTSGSLVVPAGSTFAPGGNPNNDGLIDPGETVTILFAFRAEGGNTITNLYATLLPINGVTSPTTPAPNGTPTQVFSNLFVGGPSQSQPYTFTASGSYTNGQRLVATFALMEKYGGLTNNLGTNLFTYTLGTWTMSFTNANPIVINPAPINSSQPGMATPYPSIITISNIVGTVFKTTVTLTNLTDTSEYNVNALLVAPNAADTLFLSHEGTPAIGVNGVTLTFSDTATNVLPYYGKAGQNGLSFTNGVYKPAATNGSPVFP